MCHKQTAKEELKMLAAIFGIGIPVVVIVTLVAYYYSMGQIIGG